MVKLIAADMDGTLLSSQKQLPPDFFDVVAPLLRRGVRFAIASGRQYDNIRSYFSHLENQLTYIAENGALIMEKGHVLYKSAIPAQNCGAPLQAIRGMAGVYPLFCGVKAAYTDCRQPNFLAQARRYYKTIQFVDDLCAPIDDDICRIAVFDDAPAAQNSYARLLDFEGRFKVTLSGRHWADLTNPGDNKGSAVQALCARLGLDQEQVMAFGDYFNDQELLTYCAHSFAMANAQPEIKAICRYQAASNDEGGVTKALRDHAGLFDV